VRRTVFGIRKWNRSINKQEKKKNSMCREVRRAEEWVMYPREAAAVQMQPNRHETQKNAQNNLLPNL